MLGVKNVGADLSLHVVHVAYFALLGQISTISLFARRFWPCDYRGSIPIKFGVLTPNSLAVRVVANDVQGLATWKQYYSKILFSVKAFYCDTLWNLGSYVSC